MKNLLMPASALSIKRLVLTVLCCTLPILFAAPAWADICTAATAPAPCGVTIAINGASGALTATITVVGPPYDNENEDQIVGIQNNSSVAVGTIILSAPPVTHQSPYTSKLFASDGDGACTYFEQENCGPTGYEGPNNTFVGISPDLTTGKVLFAVPLAANGGTTWFSLENTPTAVAAIGENKPLTAYSTTMFPFGPFT